MSYLLLGLLGAAGLYLTSRREPAAMLVPECLVAVADWLCFGMLNLYTYAPGLSAKPLVDIALGEFLAEFLFVPSLTLLLLTHAPVGVSVVVGTAVVTLLEFLLVREGTFIHRG